MSLTRSFSVQGAILRVWCMVLLLSCLAKADQYDTTFDPITRRTLTGDGGDGTCPNYKVIDVSKYENAKGDGKTDDTQVSVNNQFREKKTSAHPQNCVRHFYDYILFQGFLAAWKDVCSSPTAAKFLIPKGTWLTAELDFRGPCAAPQVLMELQGILLAKPDQQAFPKGFWINVMQVNNFILNGGGTLNAQGERIWHIRALGEAGKPLPDVSSSQLAT